MRQGAKKKKKDIKIGARISQEFRQTLKEYAARKDLTMENLIINALRQYLYGDK